jgi:hypothetical protein
VEALGVPGALIRSTAPGLRARPVRSLTRPGANLRQPGGAVEDRCSVLLGGGAAERFGALKEERPDRSTGWGPRSRRA